jgi:hypothetical protein
MPQKTNLNISPYYDDFDPDKNFYRVLFKPGYPIQARELTTLQSSFQNQLESFGSNVFREGSVVIPGSINYDPFYYSVKINSQNQGTDISVYIDNLVGKKVKGQTSGVIATIINYSLISQKDNIENITLFVKYNESGENNISSSFLDGEILLSQEIFSYGNTTINFNESVASLINSNACSVGSAVGITSGVYFARGTFVNVDTSIVILDPYSNTPSYRVGLNIIEEIVTPRDDNSLYDNAKGFTNYAAPGADRFKISTVLTKKLLNDFDDKNFVEIIRLDNGVVKSNKSNEPQYNIIKDYIAKRTFEESGDYFIDRVNVEVLDSLNDGISGSGLYSSDQLTEQGNIPGDDLMCVKLSPAKAYVRGYDINKSVSTIVDVEKPRITETVDRALVPFEMGTVINVNNVSGTPNISLNNNYNIINLSNQRLNSSSVSIGNTIGQARVYSFNLENSPYESASTIWNLYCFDLQTYTILTLNQSLNNSQCPRSSFIKGVSSGASGFAVFSGNSSNEITLSQVSGTFIRGEQIFINETTEVSRSIVSIKEYGVQDIKSVYQEYTNFVGLTTNFAADTVLNRVLPNQFSLTDTITITSLGDVTCPGRSFVGIKSDTIIRYQISGLSSETYNRVVSVSDNGLSMKVAGVSTVFGVCNGGLPSSTQSTTFTIGIPKIETTNSSLYTELPNKDIANINLSNAQLEISTQLKQLSTSSNGSLSVNVSNLGISSAFFNTFDTQRYSIFYGDGSVENLTSDQFTLSANGTIANFFGLKPSQTSNVTANLSVRKFNVLNKTKKYVKSEKIIVSRCSSGISTSLSGLTTSPYYGLRVSDNEISLNYPDVVKIVKIFESLDQSPPSLDKLSFPSGLNLDSLAIIGEKIIGEGSKAIAQVVSKSSSNTVEICYLNLNKFSLGENVVFEESNVSSNIQNIILGNYLDITDNFTLDQGQKEQFYDYSRIVRKPGAPSPNRHLLVVFNRYEVPENDSGDLYTVNSYPQEQFSKEIPIIGSNLRCSDLLDFRPRVKKFNGYEQSPFSFDARNFGDSLENKGIVVTPSESLVVGYSYYLPRIDKVILNKDGNFNVIPGVPSLNPKEPSDVDDSMNIAIITLPGYLYNTRDVKITLIDNRRYTMRDISKLETRISNLEKVTSLTLLELDTKSLQIQDADGLSRFKTGFFVDDFKDKNLMDLTNIDIKCDIDTVNTELISQIDYATLKPEVQFSSSIDKNTADFSVDLPLLDPNTVKKGDLISLKYDEVGWIEQPLASRVENVNPFNIIDFTGSVTLSPASDNWVRTVYINGGSRTISGDSNYTYIETIQTSSATDNYIRSRNVYFFSGNLRPFTRHYPFFDSVSGIDIVPKLLEISMVSGTFRIGETVHGYIGSNTVIKFRVCQPNHKTGAYNSPTLTFLYSPYDKTFIIPSEYSQSSSVLNVDLISLSEEAQGKYYGYVTKDVTLVGQTSNAQAKIRDIRLVTDGIGDIGGCIFFRDPLSSPPPLLRFTTGTKTFKLTSSDTNDSQLPGQLTISSAQNNYTTSGVVESYTQTSVVVRRPPPPPPPVIIQPVIRQTIIQPQVTVVKQTVIVNPPPPPPPPPKKCGKGGKDPLAQTFTVDETGAFLTSVDLYFAKKDPTERVYIEIRTVELGTPTTNVLQDFSAAYLEPSQVAISSDASIPTNVKFQSPIYLQPDTEYALVLLAPTTDNYEVWVGKMGEKTVNTQNLPNAESLIVNKQYIGGALFKSQNGSIWTPDQTEDLKFKLYKARFESSGTVLLNNPPLGPEYESEFVNNSITITTLPRKLKVGITTTYNMNQILGSSGIKVSDGNSIGNVENVGGQINTIGISNAGIGYSNGTFNNVPLYNITSSGIGAVANLQFTNNKLTSIVSIAFTGNGYSPGDVLGITTSSVVKGTDATITVSSINGIDTLFLTNVQGQNFSVGNNLLYYVGVSTVGLANTTITNSSLISDLYDGSVMEISHFNHGMHSDLNKVEIQNLSPDTIPTTLVSSLNLQDTLISVASTIPFSTFEGISTSRGFLKINNEIIEYNSVGNGVLGISSRGIDSSLIRIHDLNSQVYKYELNGVSLRRINTSFNMPTDQTLKSLRDIDLYHLKIDRFGRSTGPTQLSFADQRSYSDKFIKISNNIQFNSVLPRLNIIKPSQETIIDTQIKTITGTSSGGSEISFVEKDFEGVQLNQENKLNSTRIVCSEINEQNMLNSNKSFTMAVNLFTSDPNLSPIIDLQNSAFIFGRNRLNNPIKDYVYDSRVKLLAGDPHSSIYITKKINLSQPASSLQVLLTAYRHPSSDFRVLYKLFRQDSSEINQSYTLFPGYDNLTDTNNDGYGDTIVDSSKNSGRSDAFVRSSLNNEFLEYQYSADNLEQFSGFIIKIVMNGTDEAHPPRFKDLRVIALA